MLVAGRVEYFEVHDPNNEKAAEKLPFATHATLGSGQLPATIEQPGLFKISMAFAGSSETSLATA